MALLASIRKDLKWRLADGMSLAMWIGIPLLIGGLMSLVFSGGNNINAKVHLHLADEDDTPVTSLLAGMTSSAFDILQIDKVSASEGRRRIDDGEGSAFLTIPEGFSQAILDDDPTELTLITNPSQTIFPKMIEQTLEMLSESTFYLQHIAGDLLREIAENPPAGQNLFADVKVAAFSVKVNQRLKSLETTLLPPVLSVEDELSEAQQQTADDSASSGFGIGILMFPGILFMSMMFMGQGISFDLWREKDQGTLSRILCSPSSATTFVLAKVISGGILMAGVTIAGLALGYVALGFSAGALPGALLWCAFSGTCMLLLFFLVQMFASSSRGANVLTTALLFPLMMLGGTFFPFEAMPKWMADVGGWTPNGIAVLQLKAILNGDAEPAALMIAAAELAGLGVLLFLLSTRLVRSRFATA